ncbi:hypothetical protein MRX96_042932 [Rhipicephalus microplus]
MPPARHAPPLQPAAASPDWANKRERSAARHSLHARAAISRTDSRVMETKAMVDPRSNLTDMRKAPVLQPDDHDNTHRID